MSLAYVTVGGSLYLVYCTVAEADGLLAVDSRRAAAWAAASADAKGARLAEATRLLDELPWAGTAVSPPQRFPRAGLLDRDGSPLPDDEVPPDVELACAQLAADFLAAPGGVLVPGRNVKRVKAGPVETEFFSPTEAERVPSEALVLLGYLLVSDAGDVAGPVVPAGAEAYVTTWWTCR
jgi:hypothetical protein